MQTKKPASNFDRLKEEAENPFRAVRLFLYAAGGANALVGGLVSLTQLIGVIGDAPNALSMETVAQNLAVDFGVVVAAVLLFRFDKASDEVQKQQAAERKARDKTKLSKDDMIEREAALAELQLSVDVGEGGRRKATVGELQAQANRHVVVVAGKASMRSEALVKAQLLGARFAAQNVLIVPLSLETPAEVRQSSAMAKGFGRDTSAEKPYVATPVVDESGVPSDWLEYIEEEIEAAATQAKQSIADLKQQGIVIVARRDGRIVRRGLGAPAWEIIIDDIKDAKKS